MKNEEKVSCEKWRRMSAEEFRKDARDKKDTKLRKLKKGKVTVEEVMEMKEFKGVSKKEAEEYIKTLEQYCLIMCQFYIEIQEQVNTNLNQVA